MPRRSPRGPQLWGHGKRMVKRFCVASMTDGKFFSTEKSYIMPAAGSVKINLLPGWWNYRGSQGDFCSPGWWGHWCYQDGHCLTPSSSDTASRSYSRMSSQSTEISLMNWKLMLTTVSREICQDFIIVFLIYIWYIVIRSIIQLCFYK